MNRPVNLTVTLDDLDRIREDARAKGHSDGRSEGESAGYDRGSRAMALSVLKAVQREPLTEAIYKQMLRGTRQADILPPEDR